jgi:hypothetical protein
MRAGNFRSIALAILCSFGLGCSGASNPGGAAATSGANEGGPAASGASETLAGDGGSQPPAIADAGLGDDAADASACASYSGAVDSYSANLPKAGTSGQIQFVLMNAQPAPPAKGNNTWTLKLLDASGAPIPNATLAIKTWMPMMRHGSSIAPRQAANADDTYSISNLYLTMAGIWQVTFTAQSGSMKDTAMYTFCVGG